MRIPNLFTRFHLALAIMLAALLFLPACAVDVKDGQNGGSNNVDITTPVGGIHVSEEGDARDTGLPVYPGARLRKGDNNSNSANLGISTSAFGFKLVVVSFDSDDAPAKLIAYYRDQLKRYGDVLECHTSKHSDDLNLHTHTKQDSLECEHDDGGKTVELKVGTQKNQHIVAVEPAENGKGSTFALVYVRARGKESEI